MKKPNVREASEDYGTWLISVIVPTFSNMQAKVEGLVSNVTCMSDMKGSNVSAFER